MKNKILVINKEIDLEDFRCQRCGGRFIEDTKELKMYFVKGLLSGLIMGVLVGAIIIKF